MQRDVAEQLMEKLKALNKPTNDVLLVIELISDIKEKRLFRREMGRIIARLFTQVTLRVSEQFPDLCPSKDWQDEAGCELPAGPNS